MGRPVKPGLTYFSLDTNTYTDKKVRLFLSDFPSDDRLKIFAIYILLISRVYQDNTIAEAVDILGVSVGTLYRLIDRAGIARKEPDRKPPKEPIYFKITD